MQDKADSNDKLYRTRISFEAVNPDIEKDLTSLIKIQNKKTSEVRDATGKAALKKDERYVLYL